MTVADKKIRAEGLGDFNNLGKKAPMYQKNGKSSKKSWKSFGDRC